MPGATVIAHGPDVIDGLFAHRCCAHFNLTKSFFRLLTLAPSQLHPRFWRTIYLVLVWDVFFYSERVERQLLISQLLGPSIEKSSVEKSFIEN